MDKRGASELRPIHKVISYSLASMIFLSRLKFDGTCGWSSMRGCVGPVSLCILTFEMRGHRISGAEIGREHQSSMVYSVKLSDRKYRPCPRWIWSNLDCVCVRVCAGFHRTRSVYSRHSAWLLWSSPSNMLFWQGEACALAPKISWSLPRQSQHESKFPEKLTLVAQFLLTCLDLQTIRIFDKDDNDEWKLTCQWPAHKSVIWRVRIRIRNAHWNYRAKKRLLFLFIFFSGHFYNLEI